MIDSKLIAELFANHAAALSLYARQLVGSAEADDAVHDAFVSFMALRDVTTVHDRVAWLYRAVRNGAIDRARSRGRRKRRESSVASVHRETWFESRVDDLIDAQRVTEILHALPSDDREVIVLRIWGGFGFQQIADLLGCSVSTAFERYRVALGQIRMKLESLRCPTQATRT